MGNLNSQPVGGVLGSERGGTANALQLVPVPPRVAQEGVGDLLQPRPPPRRRHPVAPPRDEGSARRAAQPAGLRSQTMHDPIFSESGRCWWCGVPADSREHKYKKSDLIRQYGSGPWTGDQRPQRVPSTGPKGSSPLALEARSFDSRRRCAGGATTSGASPSTPPTIDSSSSPWRGARVWLARIESTSPPSTGRPGQRGPTTWVGTFASTSAADLLRRPTRSASPSRAIWLPSWTAATGQRASAATSSSIAGA
jgi:hypothetical protein